MRKRKITKLTEGMIVISLYTANRYRITAMIDEQWVEGERIDSDKLGDKQNLRVDSIRIQTI